MMGKLKAILLFVIFYLLTHSKYVGWSLVEVNMFIFDLKMSGVWMMLKLLSLWSV